MVKASEVMGRLRTFAGRIPLVPIALCLAVAFLLAEAVFAIQATTEIGCSLCHTPAQAHRELGVTPHKGQKCSSCHPGRGRFGLVDLNLRAAHDLRVELTPWAKTDPSRAFVANEACLRCHARDVASTTPGKDGKVRMRHKEPLQAGMSCRDCHARTAHVAPVTAPGLTHASCTGCHDGRTAGVACTECHARQPAAGTASLPGTEKLIHGPNGTSLHGMGQLSSCTVCHTRATCKRCHGVDLPHDMNSFPYLHGKEALQAQGACTDRCHRQEFCDSCHVLPMPHAKGFLQQHAQATARYGRPACLRCHADEDCQTCHRAHNHPQVPGLTPPSTIASGS